MLSLPVVVEHGSCTKIFMVMIIKVVDVALWSDLTGLTLMKVILFQLTRSRWEKKIMKFSIANQIDYFRLNGSQKMVFQFSISINCGKSCALWITKGVLYLFLISWIYPF